MISRLSLYCIAMMLGLLASGTTAAAPPDLGVNLQYDWVDFDDAAGTDDVDDFRRVRVALGWKATDWMEFKFEHDFESEAWTDAHVRFRTGIGDFLVGQFKQPFSLETMTSNRNRLLMESSYNSAFGIDRRVGVGYEWSNPVWLLAAGLYGKNLTGANAGEAGVARAVWTPVAGAGRTLHLGLGLGRERRDSRSFSLSTRPETGLGSLRLARTGSLTEVDQIDRIGLEAAWRNGPLLLQGEFGRLTADRDGFADMDATGAYLTAAWLFTGETHAYRNGTFGAPKPARAWGAIEGVLRLASIDFDGGTSATNGQDTATLGLNWYLTGKTRLQANYVRAEQDGSAATLLDPEIFELRIQLGF